MANPSCQAWGVPGLLESGGPSTTLKVSCRKEAIAKPATMPDKNEKLRSCSARSSCAGKARAQTMFITQEGGCCKVCYGVQHACKPAQVLSALILRQQDPDCQMRSPSARKRLLIRLLQHITERRSCTAAQRGPSCAQCPVSKHLSRLQNGGYCIAHNMTARSRSCAGRGLSETRQQPL